MKVLLPPSQQDDKDDMMDADEAFERSGCGWFQFLTQILITYLMFTFGYHCILSYFISNDPAWTCNVNATSDFCLENRQTPVKSHDRRFTKRCDLDRSEWTYTTDVKYSIVTEFDLVCDKTAVAALASSIFHIGGSVGIFLSGMAADRFGRKHVLLFSLCFLTGISMACSFVTDALQLIVSRTLIGASAISCTAISYVYLSELVPGKYRTVVIVVFSMGHVLSEFAIDALAYFLHYWRDIQWYASFPCIVGILLLKFLPESPRWQLVSGRLTEAETTLKKIGKYNGNPITSLTLKPPSGLKQRKYTYFDLIRGKHAAMLTLPQVFIWFTVSMAYYTVAFASSNLGGNIYQAFALTCTAEIPSKFAGYFVCTRLGRKKSCLVSLLLASGFALATTAIPVTFEHRYVLNICLMMCARFFADIALQSTYIWTFELFPTVLRLQGTAVCIMFERTGSFLAPFLTSVLYLVNPILPYAILMVFSLWAATGGLLLPETNNLPTREEYDDIFKKGALPQDALLSSSEDVKDEADVCEEKDPEEKTVEEKTVEQLDV